MEGSMFCRQCEQTAGGKGCTRGGVCGKSPEAADLMEAHRISSVLVVNPQGRLCGALNTHDLMRAKAVSYTHLTLPTIYPV